MVPLVGTSGSSRRGTIINAASTSFGHSGAIVDHAVAHNEFYRWYYAEHGFSSSALRTFDDIARVPIVTKSDLRAWDSVAAIEPGGGPVSREYRRHLGTAARVSTSRGGCSRESGRTCTRRGVRLGYRPTDLKLNSVATPLAASAR